MPNVKMKSKTIQSVKYCNLKQIGAEDIAGLREKNKHLEVFKLFNDPAKRYFVKVSDLNK